MKQTRVTRSTFEEAPDEALPTISRAKEEEFATAPAAYELPAGGKDVEVRTRTVTAKTSASTEPDEAGSVVRVMAYLSEEEADLLDSLWLKLRRHEARPSKSDILRAALTAAARDLDVLTDSISQQRISTLSRQRSSKLKMPIAR